MKAFIDTNVLLDVLAKREPFYKHSAAVWSLAEKGSIEGLVSAVSFTSVFYVMRRSAGAGAAREALWLVRASFAAVPCDALVISKAIDSSLPDFEDAVQYFSALHAGAECILSRDLGGYPRRPAVPVLSPTAFLAQLEIA